MKMKKNGKKMAKKWQKNSKLLSKTLHITYKVNPQKIIEDRSGKQKVVAQTSSNKQGTSKKVFYKVSSS